MLCIIYVTVSTPCSSAAEAVLDSGSPVYILSGHSRAEQLYLIGSADEGGMPGAKSVEASDNKKGMKRLLLYVFRRTAASYRIWQ